MEPEEGDRIIPLPIEVRVVVGTPTSPPKYEPKRRFRWILHVDGLDSFLMKAVSRPSYSIGLFGRKKFDPLTFVLYDPISPNGAGQVERWMQRYTRKDLMIKMVDATGSTIERWVIHDAKPTKVDYGTLDYSSEDSCTIELTVEYRDLTLEVENGD